MTTNIRSRVLGKYSSNSEKILVFIGLVAMVFILFADDRVILDSGVYVYKMKWLIDSLTYCWIASSVLSKILVFLGKKHRFINIFPIITMTALVILSEAFVTTITPPVVDPVYYVIVIVAFYSVLFTDMIIFVESFDKT